METLSSLLDDLNELSLSDRAYAEELQLQEALEASLNTNRQRPSSSTKISCEICVEEREKSEMFDLKGCPHSFCFECIRKHVEYKLQENTISISCPDQDCSNMIQPRSLIPIVRSEVIERWEEAIAESTILKRVRCPFPDCGEVFEDDDDEGVVITICECMWCKRMFCAKCKVAWHEGFDCEEFGRREKKRREEQELGALARERRWRECPNCEVFVDKIGGCIHITCRCKTEFCYVCGGDWSESHFNTCLNAQEREEA